MKNALRIHGASIFGVRPGHPFLYSIPASGPGAKLYGASGLPKGLDLDPFSGRISGRIPAKGSWNTVLKVKSGSLKAEKRFKILCGDEICLTPPLGWNSWNCWAHEVSQEKVLKSARALAARLKDYGWTYINIDDTWQGQRGKDGSIQPNSKFPDMGGLCSEIHGMGLKVGIYSTPWKISYAGYLGGSADKKKEAPWVKRPWPDYTVDQKIGKLRYEKADARQWAAWGVDYLKYDWHVNDLESTRRMQQALRASGRDIVLSLSNTAPLEELPEISKHANLWRTTGDIHNDGVPGTLWERGSLTINNYQGVKDIWRFHHLFRGLQRPGHFNDADMLVLGKIGWGNPKPTPLSRDEQQTHLALWCLFSSPLLLGCPVDELDPWTFSQLSNGELLEIQQDSLAKQAWPPVTTGKPETWIKPLEDGGLAVGLFNPHSHEAKKLGFSWADLGISGKRELRDVLNQKSLGRHKDGFSAVVPGHGVCLLKISA